MSMKKYEKVCKKYTKSKKITIIKLILQLLQYNAYKIYIVMYYNAC